MLTIFEMITRMDIFGQPINLNLDLRSKYQSVIGGLVSIFIVLLLLGYSINEIIGYTISRGIQITQETIFDYDPNLLELNQNNFLFAIRVEQATFYSSPQFDIRLMQKSNDKTTAIQLQKCTLQQFSTVLTINEEIQRFYNAQDVESWLCPTSEFTLQLKGTQFCNCHLSTIADTFQSVILEITDCETMSSWGQLCQQRLSDTYNLQLITKNTFINPFNNQFVAEDYLDNSMGLYFQRGDLYRADYSFQKHITKDYSGQIKIQGWLDDQQLSVFSTNSYKQIYEGKSSDVWVRVQFTRSNFSTFYNREYQTATDLLSKIGGLSQSVISIVGVIITYYNRAQFYLDISNRLYDYDFNQDNEQGTKGSGDPLQISVQLEQQSNIPSKKKRRITDQVKEPPEKSKDSLEGDPEYKERVLKVVEEQKKFMEHYQFKSRKHFLLATFQQTILMKDSIKLSIKYFIAKFLCLKYHPKKDPKLFILQKALTSVRQELDVFSILNRIHQVEKLKQTLLDRDQLILFNYSPKPVIAFRDKDKETNFLHYSKQQSLKKMRLDEIAESIKKQMKSSYITRENLSIESVYNAYKAIAAKNRKSNRYYYRINRKLKQFLGDQVKAIFKASKILKFPEDDNATFCSPPDLGMIEIMSVGGDTTAQLPLSLHPNVNINQQQ